jgi:mono/diheme cytochrome c family protein
MPKYRDALILAAVLSFFVLTEVGYGDAATSTSTGGESKQAEFELPQKHTSVLTPSEQRGAGLYAYYCSICHGKTGERNGFNATELTTPPAMHADPVFMSKLSDADMEKVIKGGGQALGRSPQMPPWGGVLNDQEVKDLVAFIRTLSKH